MPRLAQLARDILAQKRLRAPNTYLAAELRLGRIVEFFGQMRVAEITESTWLDYINFRRRQRADTKFFDDRKYLRQILALAVKRGIVPRIIDLPNPDLPSDRGREITADEQLRLLRAAGPELKLQIRIAVQTGLRLREMLKLRWEQIDWGRAIIVLSPADTKTRRGRQVPIPPDLFERLEERHRERGRKSRFVFPRPRDPSRPAHDNKGAWRRAKAKAHVTGRWHDLRHTAATVMIRRGVPLAVASRILGMGERVLMRIYHHTNTEDLNKAAELMVEKRRGG